MAAKDYFPTEVTDGERNAGFSQQQIENPDAHYAGHPPTINAVVYPLSLSRRIVKLRLPGDRIGYQLQRFGRYVFDKSNNKPEWLADLNFSIYDPAFAIPYFQTELADVRGQGSQIVEVVEGGHPEQPS